VVAAAVVLPPDFPTHRLSDSKQVRETERYALETLVRGGALRWGVSCAWHDEIDALNVHHATLLAMRRAFAAMLGLASPRGPEELIAGTAGAADPSPAVYPGSDGNPGAVAVDRDALTESGGLIAPDGDAGAADAGRVIVDGRFAPELPWPAEARVGGDRSVPQIQAASILAKTARDRWMIACAQRLPGYGFEQHKGYPTPDHRRALSDLGPSPIHRLSFRMTPSASA
jgi:ribonuclease HII